MFVEYIGSRGAVTDWSDEDWTEPEGPGPVEPPGLSEYVFSGRRTRVRVLTQDAWPIAGSTTHTATGALVAQAAVVSGAALHPNFSTGALVAGAATVVGTAARLTLHDASGALAAQAATVTGSAAHLTIHTSSGVLVAGAATVSGAALNGIAPPPASPSIGTGAGGGMSNNTHRATILALEAEEAIALRMKQEDEMVLDCITALVAAGVL